MAADELPGDSTRKTERQTAFQSEEEFVEAVHRCQLILQTQPEDPKANHDMGVLAMQANQKAAAVSYFANASASEPVNSGYWLDYIDALIQTGQAEEARQNLDYAEQHGLHGVEVLALARCLETNAELQVARPPLPTRNDAPRNEEIDALVSLFGQARYAEAQTFAREITLRFPSHKFAWKALGAVHFQLGQTEAALSAMQKSVELSPGDPEAYCNLGLALQKLKKLDEAESSYRAAIGINPGFLDALINLAVVLKDTDRLDEAETLCRRALQIQADHPMACSNLGIILQKAGQLSEAEACFRNVLKTRGDDADAHFNLSVILEAMGNSDDAAASCRQAILIKPDYFEAHYHLGNILRDAGRLIDAEASHTRAVHINPDDARVHNDLGIIYMKMARLDEAEASFRNAILLNSRAADVHNNLGLVLKMMGRSNDAENSYRRALEIKPDYADAHYNLGNTLKDLHRVGEAAASYRKAIHFKPDYAEACNNLGNTLGSLDQREEAVVSFQRAIQIKPDYVDAYGNLGNVLKALGRQHEAGVAFDRGLALAPNNPMLHLATAMNCLPVAPETIEEATAAPEIFGLALRELSDWLASGAVQKADFLEVAGSHQPFYLAYRDGNHVELLSRYGDLITQAGDAVLSFAQDATHKKVKLIVVSCHIRRHSVWNVILRGLLTHIDRQKFAITVYHLGRTEDEETIFARSAVDSWRDVHSISDFDGWLRAIEEDRPDVIFYPEIGMDDMTVRLATRRLAPLQVASWGHPITTGLPTMDLFLSGELIEPADADTHYRERLVKLPATGSCMMPLKIVPEELGEIEALLATRSGIRFVIAQMPSKFDPSDDALYASIAASVIDSIFIVMRATNQPFASDRVFARLSDTFRKQGLDPEKHLLMIPWLPERKFYALLEVCDVYLDCPSFSGYTTAWKAVNCGIPLVTLEGKHMRQRLAAGLLRQIDQTDTIATDRRSYVDIAVSLAKESATDPSRYATRRKLLKSAAKNASDQVEVVRAFEYTLLDELSRKNRSSGSSD